MKEDSCKNTPRSRERCCVWAERHRRGRPALKRQHRRRVPRLRDGSGEVARTGQSPAPAASATATPAPTASPTPYKLITTQGSIDAGYTSVGGTDAARFVSGSPSRIFDAGTGPFFDANGGRQLAGPNDFNGSPDLQNANLSVTFNGPFITGKIEGSFGSDADVIASNGQSRSGANLTQAYLSALKGPVTLIAGKFETLAGAEVIEAPGNSNYSRSYLFGEAIPFTHTGARLTYAYNSKVSIVAGANNGWDDWKFAGRRRRSKVRSC